MVRVGLGHFMLGAGLVLASPVLLGAQSSCLADGKAQYPWHAPLDRVVTLSDESLPLREALERISSVANIRLTYSPELLPAEAHVCARFAGRRIGDVLTTWLGGTGLAAVVVGADRVVLAPSRVQPADAEPAAAVHPAELEAVIVTGSTDDEPERQSAFARDVVTRAEIEAMGATTLQQAISAAAPGFWMWTPLPNGLPSSFGSSRGASSFGLSFPKVYIDGIEVANPLLLSTLGPDIVERIEVIRGPQGAAMYGSDAISGVINITTRHDAPLLGGPRVELRSSAGLSETDYAPLGALAQAHAINFRTGTQGRSIGLGLATSRLGAWIPGAFSRQLIASGGANFVGKDSRLQLTGRFFSQEASGLASSLLSFMSGADTSAGSQAAVSEEGPNGSPAPQSVRQYTLGANALRQGERWLYSFVLGVDGYRLDQVSLSGEIRTLSDSALLAASGGADRLTMRVSGTAQFGDEQGARAALTLGADQSVLRDATSGVSTWPLPGGIDFQESAWRNTGGLMAHGDVTLGGGMVVSGGLRLERHSGYTALSEIAMLPTMGASYTRRLGPASLRVRSAYGKAIRPPRLSRVGSDWSMQLPAVLRLEPEEQSGIESGADLTVGSAFRLRVTHFSQQATGLIQPVGVRTWGGSTSAPQWLMNYELQNVGAIDNRGWEFQGGITQGRLHLGAGYSVLESRVDRVAEAYTGDLRAGDRVLQVPARTMSLTGSWVARSWTGSWTLARAADWVNYDWLAIAGQPGGVTNPDNSAGGLRSFWRSYDGVTRLRAHFTREITEQIGFEFTGENLLGQQLGEPDNVTIVPGRTISAGLRARF